VPASDCCPSGLISSPRARGAAVSNTGVAHIDVKENMREDEMLRVPTFSSWFDRASNIMLLFVSWSQFTSMN